MSKLLRHAVEVLGAEIDKENLPPSLGIFISSDNVHKADQYAIDDIEKIQIADYKNYVKKLDDNLVLVSNLNDLGLGKIIRARDASRYFIKGRKKIKARIFKKLGRWVNTPALMVTLTFDPKKISRAEAWEQVGALRRRFLNRVNTWRKRHGYQKCKCLSVLESQNKITKYPHVHIIFPYLRYLAPLDFLTETWGMANNSVDIKYRDMMSPVGYLCKYITKMDGWSDLAMSYIWTNRTRLYSYSLDYRMPDYGDKRVPEWQYQLSVPIKGLDNLVHSVGFRYREIQGLADLYGGQSVGSYRQKPESTQGADYTLPQGDWLS